VNVPTTYHYTAQHEWVRIDDGIAIVGITDFAQCELGDIVFVELPKVGETLHKGQSFGNVESVKTVSELYAPVSGVVVRVNTALAQSPEQVNASAYEAGWMIAVEMRDEGELETLWDAPTYAAKYAHA
jgi:glycine cleavage system H protein